MLLTSIEFVDFGLDKLPEAIYSVVEGNRKEEEVMTKAQENLKSDIEKIKDETNIEKVKIFIMGILAQQKLEQPRKPPENPPT